MVHEEVATQVISLTLSCDRIGCDATFASTIGTEDAIELRAEAHEYGWSRVQTGADLVDRCPEHHP
jgi:hypothetical protein